MRSFRVNREKKAGSYKLPQIFNGLENVPVLKKCINDPSMLQNILLETNVTLTSDGTRYMHVDDEDGRIVVALNYLREADDRYLYLDIIHELIHVKQFLDGKELFDNSFDYVSRPTELEAYRCVVEEGRRLGMTDDDLIRYLYVEWISESEFARMLNTLGVTQS